MKIISKILALLNYVSCGFQSQQMNEEKFTKYYFECISSKYPEVNYEIIDFLILKATKREEEEVFHYLDNAFREYRLEPKELKEIVDKYLESLEELYNKQTEIDINRIVPMIKPRDYLDTVGKLGEKVKSNKKTI